jgi:hypothetical protein
MLRFFFHVPAAMLPVLTLLAIGAGFSEANAIECKSVRGALEETYVTGPACTSPVGLCTSARMFGHLKGEARFTATAITSSADTPTTGVVFVIGDTSIQDARLGGKRGALAIKNAAAFRTIGEGDLSDIQVIVGGAGDFIGATGSLRMSGTFVNGSGTSSFEGSVCVP